MTALSSALEAELIDLRLDRLTDITEDLKALYTHCAELTVAMRRQDAETWFEYGSNLFDENGKPAKITDKQREMALKFQNYTPDDGGPGLGAELLKREAEIKALIEERDHIRLLLVHGR